MKTARRVDVEVLPPERERLSHPAAESLMRLIAQVMDNAFRIPGTQIRFGLDPILGLLPGFGDTASAFISVLTLVQSARSGIPKIIMARMAMNVLLNTLVGAIPIAGDAFSFWFKSNQRNLELFQKSVRTRRPSTRADWLFVLLVLLAIVAVLIGSIAAGVYLLNTLWPQLGSTAFTPSLW